MGLRKMAPLSCWYMVTYYESDDVLCVLAFAGQGETVTLYSIHYIAGLHK
jgi:hypothetical protein